MAVDSFNPIYPCTPRCEFGTLLTTANNNMDGSGSIVTVYTAPSTKGARVDSVTFQALGSNVQTVARFFVWDQTAAAWKLFDQRTLLATTASATAATAMEEHRIDRAIQPNGKIGVAIGTTVAAGWQPIGWGGDYV